MNRVFTAIAMGILPIASMLASSISYAPHIGMRAPQVNDEVIYDQPEGELSWLDRTCDGFVTVAFDATHSIIRGSVVQRVDGEDGFVYLSHMASEYPVNTWTRFQKEGNTLVMEGVQALYVEYDYDYDEELIVYLAPMELVVDENNIGSFVVNDDCRYVLNVGEDGSLTSADPDMILGVCVHTLNEDIQGNDVWLWKGFGDRNVSMVPANGVPVSIPEGIEVVNWVLNDGDMNSFVQVAIEGEDFYINGMDRSLPDSWVKGKIADGKVTFPSGQYLGADMEIYYYSYFCGADFSDEVDEDGKVTRVASLADSSVFNYDAETGSLTLERGYVINSTPDKLFPLYFYENVKIGMQNRDPEAAPSAPYGLEYYEDDWDSSVWFMLPNTDVNGEILNVENLYYEIYVNGELQYFDIEDKDWNVENTSRIPYMYDDWMDFWVASDDPRDHTVYLYYDGEVEYVGIRSIYVNENGEDVYSEMAYWGDPDSVNSIGDGKTPVSVKWYDLQGREIKNPVCGVSVKVSVFSDGTTSSEKVIVR
ncbi:MAG: hypothetical protein K2N48_04420 [Muribaculaceae bacterium]|nr:hypothetical protein [Muribaculaceae bacterium]